MHPIDALAHGAAMVLGVFLSIGLVTAIFNAWRLQKAEDEFWNGWILRDGKMNPDYMDNYRVNRMLGTYKGGDK
tara:strand:- start:241 stop:462 length:222 start_codon:yes stop_codon:yes gene_type:complete